MIKNYVFELICAVGGSVAVGGLFIFIYAVNMTRPEYILGIVRQRATVGGFGCAIAVIGIAVLLFGVLMIRRSISSRT